MVDYQRPDLDRTFAALADPTRRADHRVLFWAYMAIPAQYVLVAVHWYGVFIIFIPVYWFLLMPMRMDTRRKTLWLKSCKVRSISMDASRARMAWSASGWGAPKKNIMPSPRNLLT